MGTTGQTIRLYWQAVKPYWRSGLLTVLLIVTAVLLDDIARPYLASRIFDSLADVANGTATIAASLDYFWILAVVSALAFVAWRVSDIINVSRQPKILRDIEQRVFSHLTRQSYDFFTNRFGGALVAQAGRFARGYENLEDVLQWELLETSVRLIGSTILLLILLPPVGLALLVWSVLFTTSVVWLNVKKQRFNRREASADSAVTARIADVITNMMNVMAFGRRREEIAGYANTTDHQRRIRHRSWNLDAAIRLYQNVMMLLFGLLVLWLTIKLVGGGSAGLADALLANFYIGRIFGDLWNIGSVTRRVSRAFGDATEMTEVLITPPTVTDPKNPRPLAVAQSEIHFDKVTFAYPGHQPVFRNFSLTIRSGERVGLVGHSGSGKSTLVRLLLRFADLNQGEILIDWQNIAKVTQDDLRRQIAYVPQEPVLFHRSLADNIHYGRAAASLSEIREAARLAHAADFIEKLPSGYQTLVGERGIKLSGGEKQRVAIARAMLSRAPILVLDEATSSLDSKSEKLITDGLKRLMQNRTTLVIAHRLSTIRNLDRILLFSNGRIVESGSHRELIDRDGAYAELWKHQSGGFLKDE